MLAALLLPVAVSQLLLVRGRLNEFINSPQAPNYTHLIKWLKKKVELDKNFNKDLLDKLEKSKIITVEELIELDEEETIVYILMTLL